jgi:cysteine desulfurase/selenocysteine lyase
VEGERCRAEVRRLGAQLLGCKPEEIGLVPNTSAGLIAVARSVPFKPGERVIVFDGEFPANVTPWQLVAQDRGLEVEHLSLAPYARSHAEGLHALERALADGARLVAVSAVQFQTGLRMPLREMARLCHAHGAELCVDAIQALGVVPIDVKADGIDYLAAGGHKFLMGLEGAGLLYISERALPALSLGLAGWTGHVDAFGFLTGTTGQLRYDRPIARSASFVEQGTLNTVGYAALAAALELLLELGVEAIHAHVSAYLDALEEGLVALGCESVRSREPEGRSAILSVKLPGEHSLATVAGELAAAGVFVSTPDGHLRFAPHFPNALDEVPEVLRAVEAALGKA